MDLFQPPDRGDKKDAILLVVSRGLSDFIQNAIVSIQRTGPASSMICIALPQNALAEVQAALSGFQDIKYFFLEDVCHADYSSIAKYQNYGSEAFSRITASKWPAIRFLLGSGFRRVTYTDADIAWIRDPMPLLRAALQAYEIAIQTEGLDNFPPQYCTGFMSFRNSEFTIVLLTELEKINFETLRSEPDANDQVVFNRLIVGSRGMIPRIFNLSELLFANGLSAGAMSSCDDELTKIMVRRIEPMIFHANWTVGIDNKRRLLQRTGNWLIDR